MAAIRNLLGLPPFGKLTVVRFHRTHKRHAYWQCRCACGRLWIVQSSDLVNGRTRSCGCATGELRAASYRRTMRQRSQDAEARP